MKIKPDAEVIIVSGDTSAEAKKQVSLLGAIGFIEKPYDFQEILTSSRVS